MKKKIATTLLMVIGIVIFIIVIRISKNGSSEGDNNSSSIDLTVQDEFRYYPENDYNYPVGEYLEWNSKERIEFVVEANVEKGAIIFRIYDMNGAEYNQNEKYILCEEHIIDSTGEYTFVPENLEDGKMYYVCLAPEDDKLEKQERYVVANGFFRSNRYRSK